MRVPPDPEIPTGNQPENNKTSSPRIRVKNRKALSNGWAYLEQVVFEYLRRDGDWQIQHREIYHRGHGAAVLLYNLDTSTIVLTKQFRFPAWDVGDDGFLIEVPAGIIEHKKPEETVRAETEEETGFIIDKPTFLFRAYASPGSVTEQLHYFCAPYDSAKRKHQGGGVAGEGEDIEVLEVGINEAVAWINEGRIIDAKSIILIQYAQLHLFSAGLTPGK